MRLSLQIDSEASHGSIAKGVALWFLQLKHPSSREAGREADAGREPVGA